MSKKNSRNIYGFTLIELLLALSIISLVILISSNLVIFGVKSHKLTANKYDLQSSIRLATEQTNQIVRYSKAVFAVPQTFVANTSVMDPGWDYFMVSQDKKRVVTMEYNKDTNRHEERVIVGEQDNIVYEVFFEKDTSVNSDSVMKYKIYAYVTDSKGKKTREVLVFESTVESINAIQVADKGSVAAPSIALAYRSDGQTSGKGKNQIAYITIVVDVSGSMLANPNGVYEYDRRGDRIEYKDSRIRHVRKALGGSESNPDTGIIQQFSKEENVFISLVPFSTTGNYPSPTANTNPNSRHHIYEVYDNTKKNDLVEIIKKMEAEGGTNTGDGLRQAYNLHNDFRTRMSIDEKTQIHHYMVLLVDGETTYEVKKGIWERIEYWDWFIKKIRWDFKVSNSEPKYYLNVGNISFYYGSNSYSSNPNTTYAITGNGNSIINNSPYVNAVGKLIKNFDAGNGVKSYIIGYAKDLGTHISSIGTSIGTESDNIYKYDDPGFNLDEIFKNIATDIMADFWLVSGPQIQE